MIVNGTKGPVPGSLVDRSVSALSCTALDVIENLAKVVHRSLTWCTTRMKRILAGRDYSF
jgi:hypothetical protein